MHRLFPTLCAILKNGIALIIAGTLSWQLRW